MYQLCKNITWISKTSALSNGSFKDFIKKVWLEAFILWPTDRRFCRNSLVPRWKRMLSVRIWASWWWFLHLEEEQSTNHRVFLACTWILHYRQLYHILSHSVHHINVRRTQTFVLTIQTQKSRKKFRGFSECAKTHFTVRIQRGLLGMLHNKDANVAFVIHFQVLFSNSKKVS